MNEIMLILAFLCGAAVYHFATTQKTLETPVKPKKRTIPTEVVATEPEEEVDSVKPEIERVLAEMKPPNIFERRERIEAVERELDERRRRAIQ